MRLEIKEYNSLAVYYIQSKLMSTNLAICTIVFQDNGSGPVLSREGGWSWAGRIVGVGKVKKMVGEMRDGWRLIEK